MGEIKKYKGTKRKIIVSLLGGQRKIQKQLAEELKVDKAKVDEARISLIAKELEEEGIIKRKFGRSPREYIDNKSDKKTKREYPVLFCYLNPSVEAFKKIFYGLDIMTDSTLHRKCRKKGRKKGYYNVVGPKLTAKFLKKIDAAGIPQPISWEKARMQILFHKGCRPLIATSFVSDDELKKMYDQSESELKETKEGREKWRKLLRDRRLPERQIGELLPNVGNTVWEYLLKEMDSMDKSMDRIFDLKEKMDA
ncbi:MAG: hypothetical protein IB616_04980 [Methanosarcinales archaeon]|nr:MAG: hypothetical protein IB616_04980 [Methanosarcinales archaeon]